MPEIDPAADAQQRYSTLQARYVLEGSIHKPPGKFQVMVQLINWRRGTIFGPTGCRTRVTTSIPCRSMLLTEFINRLLAFPVPFRVMSSSERGASLSPLKNTDYAWRGQQFALQFTKDAHAKWRQIVQEGLARFPESRGFA